MAALPYWRLSSFYLFYFALLGATAPFLALYFDHLGFPSARIGELIAIPMLMRCVGPNIWGWLGDYTGRRLPIVRFGAVCTLVCFSLILVDKSYAWLAMVMALHAFFWHAVLPQFEVITLAHLQGQTARYSQIRLWGSIGFILTVVGLGRLFEWFSLDLYPQALLFIMAGIVASSWWVPNAQPVSSGPRQAGDGFLRQLLSPGVLAFYGSVALMQLSHGPYYTFLTLHLEHMGYTRGIIGMLWAVGVVAEVLGGGVGWGRGDVERREGRVVAEEVTCVDVDAGELAGNAELHDGGVVAGMTATARLPAVHPLAAVGVAVCVPHRRMGLHEVVFGGEEGVA